METTFIGIHDTMTKVTVERADYEMHVSSAGETFKFTAAALEAIGNDPDIEDAGVERESGNVTLVLYHEDIGWMLRLLTMEEDEYEQEMRFIKNAHSHIYDDADF